MFLDMGKRARSGSSGGTLAKRRRVSTGRVKKRRGSLTARQNLRTAGFLGIEHKYYDTSQTAVIASPSDCSAGEVDPTSNGLNTVAQGDGQQNRDGKMISMTRIDIHGRVYFADQTGQNDVDTPPDVFIALVRDSQTNGAQLQSENVFKNPLGTVQTATSVFRNLEHTKRFRILATIKIAAQDWGPAVPIWDATANNIKQMGASRPWEMHVDLKGLQTNFSNTTESIANVVDNSLHLVAYCTNQVDGLAGIVYNSRLRFYG